MLAVLGIGLGAIAGSFLNALSFRMGTGRIMTLFSPTSTGRSRCMHCGHTLSSIDLVPVLSWLSLWGRCRYCGSRISMQYPLVELAGAALGLWSALIHPQPFFFALYFLINLALLFVVVYDLRHMVIPWSAAGTLALLTGVLLIAEGGSASDWWAGIALSAPLALIFLLSRGRAMGLGDAMLEISLGWLLGFTVGLTALVAAFWLGASVGIALIVLRRRYTMRSELPFAPFLIAGAWLTLLFNVDLFSTLPALFF